MVARLALNIKDVNIIIWILEVQLHCSHSFHTVISKIVLATCRRTRDRISLCRALLH